MISICPDDNLHSGFFAAVLFPIALVADIFAKRKNPAGLNLPVKKEAD